MWRRALIASAATVGASTAFLAVVVLLVGSVVDFAVASKDDAATGTEAAGTVSSPDSVARDKLGAKERARTRKQDGSGPVESNKLDS